MSRNNKERYICRINKLFKILEHRNQQDVSTWLSHIQFLKTNGWEDGVSRLYLRLLQVRMRECGLGLGMHLNRSAHEKQPGRQEPRNSVARQACAFAIY